ncbi:MAG: type II secretion system protein [Patescibacteria group bacterium]
MKNRGFTVVEMIVVIAVVGILASLGTVQMIRSQTAVRDKERADDVKSINLTLQDVYNNGNIDGNIIASGDGSVTSAVAMGYPSTKLLDAAYAYDSQTYSIIQNIRLDARKSPYLASTATSPSFSMIAATTNVGLNDTTKTAGGRTLGVSSDIYVYQPLDSNGAICQYATGLVSTGTGVSATTGKAGSTSQAVIAPRLVNNCVKFNIFYYSESWDSIVKVESQKSSSDGLY